MTTGNLMLDRQMARWYPLKPHPVQLSLVDAVPSGVRFPLVPAGRRSGKTERAKRFIVKQSNRVPGLYFAAAPTYNQAKKIFWDDLKSLSLSSCHDKKPSESDLKIFMPNGSEIHVLGLDNSARIEGIPWAGGLLDEVADLKSDAWPLHILPALNTVNPTNPDYRAWCWLLGVPDGFNHYYDLCTQAEIDKDSDFKVFHWKSSEILPPDVIESAKRSMSKKQFNQEFNASFETAEGRIYEDYSPANHTTETIQPHEQLCWMHDQNYTPLSSAIGVRRNNNNDLYILDEIILTGAVSRQSAEEFVDKFKGHQNKHVLIYGDPAGRAGEKHGQISSYTEIEKVLGMHGWTYSRLVETSHPAIKDRQNAVRAKIKNAAGEITLFVNPIKAPYSEKGLSTVQLKKGSSFLEDDSNQYQHITTAIGYMVSVEWPVNSEYFTIKAGFTR